MAHDGSDEFLLISKIVVNNALRYARMLGHARNRQASDA
jgi:hypothetical protein